MRRLLSAIFEAICLIKMVGTKASCLNVSLLLLKSTQCVCFELQKCFIVFAVN